MKKSTFKSIIGRKIKEFRVKSFYIDRKLICDVIVLYMQIDTGEWFKFTTSDGENSVELLIKEPITVKLENIEDEFAYPIKVIKLDFIGSTITDIKQYIWNNQADELNGFYIELDKKKGFSLIDVDDCLKIFDGILLHDDYTLS